MADVQGAATREYLHLAQTPASSYKVYNVSIAAGATETLDITTDLGKMAVVVLITNLTAQQCYARFNALVNDRKIILASKEFSIAKDELEVGKIYLQNSDSGASTASVEVMVTG